MTWSWLLDVFWMEKWLKTSGLWWLFGCFWLNQTTDHRCTVGSVAQSRSRQLIPLVLKAGSSVSNPSGSMLTGKPRKDSTAMNIPWKTSWTTSKYNKKNSLGITAGFSTCFSVGVLRVLLHFSDDPITAGCPRNFGCVLLSFWEYTGNPLSKLHLQSKKRGLFISKKSSID